MPGLKGFLIGCIGFAELSQVSDEVGVSQSGVGGGGGGSVGREGEKDGTASDENNGNYWNGSTTFNSAS
jgi:hypothetical protein